MKSRGSVVSKIVIFSLIFLVVGGVVGYFIGEHSSRGNNNFRYGNGNFSNENFQLNDTVRAEVTSFFDNSPTTVEINDYCQTNPRYCIEYCRVINPSNEICNSLNISNFRGGMPTK